MLMSAALVVGMEKSENSRQPMDDDDDGDDYEYGDSIAHAREENPADFSVHQFLAKDDARGVEGSDDDDDNSANDGGDDGAAEAVKDASQDDDDHWNSELTPEEDSSFFSVEAKGIKHPKDTSPGFLALNKHS